ncbi:GtrA family protein [Cupriavidus sp. YAF13]|uniref:GtrA family protein n=1 Tax=Cupriavidus sp. YAF13 TaxID=3233075 RepID=UPI003F90B620
MEEPALESPYVSERQRRLGSTLFRYVLVGLLSNAAGYGIYILVTWLGVKPMLAMSLLYSIGAMLGFFGNRQWAFAHDGKALHSLVRYWATHLIGYGLNFSMLYFFVNRLGYSHQLVQAIAVFVVAGFLFLMFNFFVFPQSRETRRS